MPTKAKNSKKHLDVKKSMPPNNNDDDESVDSRGNLRDLIDYDYDSDNDEVKSPRPMKRKPRRASLAFLQTLKKFKNNENEIVDNDDDDEDDDEDVEEDYIDEEDDEEDEEDEDDEEDEEDEDVEEENKEEENIKEKPKSILQISFGGFGSRKIEDHLKPKRYSLKKESLEVQKFVELLTKVEEETTIDDQIDYFKSLDIDNQKKVITALSQKKNKVEDVLMFKILRMNVSNELQSLLLSKYNTLQMMDPSNGEYFKHRAWLEKAISVPFGIYKELPANIDDGAEKCHNFMKTAQQCLADAIYGQEEAKLEILQFIATKLANPQGNGLSLLLCGVPGVGKTSLIKNGIAKALNWPFEFISLGGDSDATTYTGHQLVYEGSHCGKIVNSLVSAKSMSMVMMFDELDKISDTPKGEEVQNLLIHLTDSVQNNAFEDKYLSGLPIDLSKIMFVFSANDISKISKILLDRMIVINLKGYKKEEKLQIAEKFLLPNAIKDVNLTDKIKITKEILEYILKEYVKEEPGVREFKRAIEQVIKKINMLRVFNSKEMPFYIENFTLPFTIEKKHIDLFLKKKNDDDTSYLRMYV